MTIHKWFLTFICISHNLWVLFIRKILPRRRHLWLAPYIMDGPLHISPDSPIQRLSCQCQPKYIIYWVLSLASEAEAVAARTPLEGRAAVSSSLLASPPSPLRPHFSIMPIRFRNCRPDFTCVGRLDCRYIVMVMYSILDARRTPIKVDITWHTYAIYQC